MTETKTLSRMRQPRTPIAERTLPDFTRTEEVLNMATHILGAVFGVVALVLCVVFAALHHNPAGVISGAIYGASMIMCYTVSSVYHGIDPKTKKRTRGKKVMRVLDHCDIYFLIAGSYTPMALTALRVAHPVVAWVSLGIVWGVCIFGCVFTAIDFHKYSVLSFTSYFLAGWSVLAAMPAIYGTFGMEFIVLVLTGGVVYTLGMVFFALQQKYRYCHSVFHLFILGGSALQFIPILKYCM